MNWARVKAETEHDLAKLGLAGCIAWRPAMILPDAAPERLTLVQQLGSLLARPLGFLPHVSIGNTGIGEAMLQATLEGRRKGIVENLEMRRLAERYRRDRHQTPAS